jgi:hypothetical protein
MTPVAKLGYFQQADSAFVACVPASACVAVSETPFSSAAGSNKLSLEPVLRALVTLLSPHQCVKSPLPVYLVVELSANGFRCTDGR